MQGVVMVAASVKNLSYTYQVTSTSFSSRVLENISFSVNEGDSLIIYDTMLYLQFKRYDFKRH